jgi:hypothetical protein
MERSISDFEKINLQAYTDPAVEVESKGRRSIAAIVF